MEQCSANIALTVCSCALVLFNLFGNTLVCVVIIGNKHMRTPLNYLLFNLAVADILIGVLYLPGSLFGTMFHEQEGVTAEFFCRFFTYGTVIYPCGDVSAFSLAAVAYERYQAVIYPLTVKEKITKKKTFVFIIIVWICSLTAFLPWYFWVDLERNTLPKCSIIPQYLKTAMTHLYIFGVSIYGAAVVVMIILYGRIIWKLFMKQDQVIDQNQLAASKAKKKITIMLITVTLIFAVLWSVATGVIIKYGSTENDFALRTCNLVILINSSVNWVLYALFSEQFRNAFRKALSCCSEPQRIVAPNIRHLAATPQVEGERTSQDIMDTKM